MIPAYLIGLGTGIAISLLIYILKETHESNRLRKR